jgi:predicted nuclease of restriction endonuclease-like (RecB) superfamily
MPAKKKTTIAKRKSSPSTKKVGKDLDFTSLVDSIRQVHEQSAAHVNRTVNTTLTLRNWVIGAYIHHYELHGADRAKYGDSLIGKLAEKLTSKCLERMDERELRRYRLFYITYPGIRESLTPEFMPLLATPIWRSLTAKSERDSDSAGIQKSLISESQQPNPSVAIFRSLTGKFPTAPLSAIRESVTPELGNCPTDPEVETLSSQFGAPMRKLVSALSFTHIAELITIEDPLKRAFYEIECIRGNWSVRALRRQIATLYFERSGLSKDKEKLAAMVQKGVETSEPKLAIRDPYIFEFLGLRAKDAVAESDLEAALVENLREFLLELGHGFCLEAQQKSIVIGKTSGFVDLVFYHRILKCHVLVELKIDEFKHEHLGQLNTYVTWYRKHMMSAGDNPPVGLLLCTDKDHALVEYATASVDNQLFVSKYAVELPSKAELEKFLHAKHLEMLGKA